MYAWKEPHFAYFGGRLQTVFEEPDPGSDLFTPGLVFISGGYGQRHKNIFLQESDIIEAKAGIRAQRRWGDDLSSDEREVKVGLEARLKYENTIREGIVWHLEAETFAPFDDMGHITTWAEIGLEIEITKWIIANFSARAYYETKPDSATTGRGYDELSLRQEALIGLSWSL